MSNRSLKIYVKDKPIFDALKGLSKEQLLATPLTKVPFGERAQNIFDRRNIGTLGDLARLSRFELLKMQNLGRTTLSLIEFYLGELGLHLGYRYTPPEPTPVRQDVGALLERQRELSRELEAVTRQLTEALC